MHARGRPLGNPIPTKQLPRNAYMEISWTPEPSPRSSPVPPSFYGQDDQQEDGGLPLYDEEHNNRQAMMMHLQGLLSSQPPQAEVIPIFHPVPQQLPSIVVPASVNTEKASLAEKPVTFFALLWASSHMDQDALKNGFHIDIIQESFLEAYGISADQIPQEGSITLAGGTQCLDAFMRGLSNRILDTAEMQLGSATPGQKKLARTSIEIVNFGVEYMQRQTQVFLQGHGKVDNSFWQGVRAAFQDYVGIKTKSYSDLCGRQLVVDGSIFQDVRSRKPAFRSVRKVKWIAEMLSQF